MCYDIKRAIPIKQYSLMLKSC